MKRKMSLYPGIAEAEKERAKKLHYTETEPEFIGSAPNYDYFEKLGFSAEKTLVWLNID